MTGSAAEPAGAPLVTVCMPAHRDSEFFRAALASVLSQTMPDLEVIVGDDSGGGLQAAVEAANDPRVHYVPNAERLGFARNHIATMDAARGKYVAVLHDDDLHHADYLEQMTAVLEADPELGLACSDLWEVFPDGRRQRPGDWIAGGRYDDWLELALRHNFFVPTSTVIRREVWAGRRSKTWPEATVGDVVFWYDAALDGTPMYWIDRPLADYRRHDGQISGLIQTRGDQVLVNRLYRFDDRPEVELLRRRRVALGLVGRGGARLRTGDAKGARADLIEAAEESPQTLARKRRLLLAATYLPGVGLLVKLLAKVRG